jgi:alkylhydroperoxidase family enzyme
MRWPPPTKDPRRAITEAALGDAENGGAVRLRNDAGRESVRRCVAALRTHFDTTEIVELTSAIATYNMVARFQVHLGVSPPDTLLPLVQ